MALPIQVKFNDTFYTGHKLTVSAGTGDYTLDMTLTSGKNSVNGINIITSEAGDGDTFKLEKLDSGNNVLVVLAQTVYNVGKNAAIKLDFPTAILMTETDKIRLTYTNAAGVAMSVFTILERIT
jgi:hypothetical protein